MENKQIPVEKETANDRPPQSVINVEDKPRTREEEFDAADEDHEVSFDLPRD